MQRCACSAPLITDGTAALSGVSTMRDVRGGPDLLPLRQKSGGLWSDARAPVRSKRKAPRGLRGAESVRRNDGLVDYLADPPFRRITSPFIVATLISGPPPFNVPVTSLPPLIVGTFGAGGSGGTGIASGLGCAALSTF